MFEKFNKKKKNSLNYESEYLKQTIEVEDKINRRFIVLSVVICLLLSCIVYRLYKVEIVYEDYYTKKLEEYTSVKKSVTTPRGEILDRNGNVLVGNTQVINITYFPNSSTTSVEEWELAYEFVKDFDYDIKYQTSRDLKDLFLTTQTNTFKKWVKNLEHHEYDFLINDEQKEKYDNLLSNEDYARYNNGELTSNDLYYIRLENISDDILDQFDETLRKVWALKQAMDAPNSGQANVVLTNLTMEETAFFIEHSEKYPGFDIEIDWERYYPYKETLKGVFGSVTSKTQGLPLDKLDYYLALGYALNDKVGKSGLEYEYEDLLSGQKAIYDIEYDENGDVYFIEDTQGGKGYDLKTTIDIDLQLYIEKLLTQILKEHEDDEFREYMKMINVVVQDPKTGDVLAMVNVSRDDENNYYLDPLATYTLAFEPGSIVKGATVYMGLNEGVIEPNEIIKDEPIKLRATPIKGSWKNLGLINETQALAQSSNVYMFNIAMRLAGTEYYYDCPLYVQDNTFNLMRNYYAAFGLGIQTGIDLPNEAVGYKGISETGGLVLDYSIGQYDTYTTLQLSQYIATIANNGIKMRPRVVSDAFMPQTHEVIYQNEVEVLNVLENDMAMSRVQQGFYECVNSKNGICYGYGPLKNEIAAKTGTAEAYVYVDDERVDAPHNSVVSYAPIEDPKISIACMIPNAWNGDKTQPNLCLNITNNIIHAYLTHDYTLGLTE